MADGKRRYSQSSLAIEALKRIGPVCESGIIVSVPQPRNAQLYDHETRLLSCVDSDGVFVVPSIKDKKERDAFRVWIQRRAVRVAKNTYKLKDANK